VGHAVDLVRNTPGRRARGRTHRHRVACRGVPRHQRDRPAHGRSALAAAV